jgi:hypothetical protein
VEKGEEADEQTLQERPSLLPLCEQELRHEPASAAQSNVGGGAKAQPKAHISRGGRTQMSVPLVRGRIMLRGTDPTQNRSRAQLRRQGWCVGSGPTGRAYGAR